MNWIWIKKNQNKLLTLVAVTVLAICSIPFWLHNLNKQNEVASNAYYKALQTLKPDNPESAKITRKALEKVMIQYPTSKAAHMAGLYAAHLSFKLNEFEKARETYEHLLTQLKEANPLRPIALAGLKSAYQSLGNLEKVKNLNSELEKLGFSEK